jgi:hypothetical protein
MTKKPYRDSKGRFAKRPKVRRDALGRFATKPKAKRKARGAKRKVRGARREARGPRLKVRGARPKVKVRGPKLAPTIEDVLSEVRGADTARGPTGLPIIQTRPVEIETRGYFFRLEAFVTADWATPSAPVFEDMPGSAWYRTFWCTKVRRTISEAIHELDYLTTKQGDFSEAAELPYQIETVELVTVVGTGWMTVSLDKVAVEDNMVELPNWMYDAE